VKGSLCWRGAAVVLLLGSACALGPVGVSSRGEDQREWSEAMRLASADPARGAEALAAFVRTHPKSALADDAGLRLAELNLQKGDAATAARQLEWVVANHSNGDQSDRARLTLAKLERERGEPSRARATARKIRVQKLAPPERREAQRLLAALAADAQDPADQLRWLGDLAADPGPGTSDVGAQIDAAVTALPDDMLGDVASALGRRPIAASVRLEETERALRAGDRDAAERALRAAKRLPLAPPDAEKLVRLEGRLSEEPSASALSLLQSANPSEGAPSDPFVSTAALEVTLGAVLPLSGAAASFGEEALQGILLAAGAFDGATYARAGPRVVIRDTRGQPAEAAAAVRSLAAEPGMLAVVGPLLPDEAEAAAAAAQEAGVPLIALSRREGVGRGRPHVLRAGTSPRLEAELLAEYAIHGAGLRRFAILYPDDAIGLALRAAFWNAVEARGGSVVAVASYPVGATDFAAPIRRMIGYELLPPGALGQLAEREKLLKRAKRLPPAEAEKLREEARALTGPDGEPLPPYVDFDALFIPDAHQTAGLIAPHLAFHEVTGVRLLGPSAWNHPNFVRLGGRHVEGALFPGAFNAAVSARHVVTFGEHFQTSFGAAPSSLAAEAFDAANLALAAAAQGARDRDDVAAAIAEQPRRVGVSGVLQLGPDGEVARRPHLLGVSEGQVVCVDELGSAPPAPAAR
jgi:ABC-type branched-subunit amino acid transport system substrate-binding protein